MTFRTSVGDAGRLKFPARDAIRIALRVARPTRDDWSPEAREAAAKARKENANPHDPKRQSWHHELLKNGYRHYESMPMIGSSKGDTRHNYVNKKGGGASVSTTSEGGTSHWYTPKKRGHGEADLLAHLSNYKNEQGRVRGSRST